MTKASPRVRIEGLDFARVFPALHLFRAFRLAIHPPKLLLALLLVILLYAVGVVLDNIHGPAVFPQEVQRYSQLLRSDFAVWRQSQPDRISANIMALVPEYPEQPANQPAPSLSALMLGARQAIAQSYREQIKAIDNLPAKADETDDQTQARRAQQRQNLEKLYVARLASLSAMEPQGVFRAALHHEVITFRQTLRAATQLEFGFTQFLFGHTDDSQTVIGGLYEMLVTVPLWLLRHHTLFLVCYCFFGLLLWGLFGGGLSRMAALHATRDIRIGPSQAVRYAFGRWHWFVLAPLLPVAVSLALAGVLVGFGFLFFGIPKAHILLDLLGGLFFMAALLIGLVLSVLLIGLVASYNLIYPGVATDDSDGFDANSRAFSYLIARPWHLLAYYCISLVYGAVTYLFFALVIFGTLSTVQSLVSVGAGLSGSQTVSSSRFDAMFPPPELGRLAYSPEWSMLTSPGDAATFTSRVAAIMIMVWVYMFVGLLAAFAISFYFSSQTLVYLLMRSSVDKTDLDEAVLMPDDEADAGLTPAPAAPAKPAGDPEPSSLSQGD